MNTKNFIVYGIIIIFCIVFVILCGTLIPIIVNKFTTDILQIDASFYMLWGMPLGTAMLILLGCSVLLKEKKYNFFEFAKTIIIPFATAIIITFVLFFFNKSPQ